MVEWFTYRGDDNFLPAVLVFASFTMIRGGCRKIVREYLPVHSCFRFPFKRFPKRLYSPCLYLFGLVLIKINTTKSQYAYRCQNYHNQRRSYLLIHNVLMPLYYKLQIRSAPTLSFSVTDSINLLSYFLSINQKIQKQEPLEEKRQYM